MKWKIEYEEKAYKFLKSEKALKKVEEVFYRYLKGLKVDVKKLKGEWEGYFRLRIGKIRVIFYLDKRLRKIVIQIADYRGGVYKK